MTMRRLRLAGVLAAGLLVGAMASADVRAQGAPSPEALRIAQDLTGLVGAATMAELVRSMNEKVWPNLEAAVRRRHPNIDATTLLELRTDFERLQVATAQDVMKDAAGIYARHLTADEMRAMIAFYRSPAGAKSLAVTPAIQGELSAAMAPRVQGLQARLTLAYLDLLQRKGLTPR